MLLVVALLIVAACHRPEPVAEAPTPSAQQKRAERASKVPTATQRHWTFLNRIRQHDAFNSAIQRTLVNDQNELGVVLYSSVASDKVSDLMRKVMAEMAQEFPREDVTLAVYKAGTPPQKIGAAHLDGKTEEATYATL